MNKSNKNKKKSLLKRIIKTIIITFITLFVIALVFLFVIPSILNFFNGQDIEVIDDSDLQLKVVNILDEENSFFELKELKDHINLDSLPDNINFTKDYLKSDEWDNEVVLKLLDDNKEAFDLFDKAYQKGVYQVPNTANPEDISHMMEVIPMNHYRNIARLSAIKSIWMSKNGEYEKSLDEAFKIIVIGDSIERSQGATITYLIGLGLKEIGIESYSKALEYSADSSLDLNYYRKKLSKYNVSNNTAQFKGEYLVAKKVILSIGDGSLKFPEHIPEPMNSYYFKPNLTLSYSYDFHKDIIDNWSSCDVGPELKTSKKDILKIDSILDVPRIYFTENAIGIMLVALSDGWVSGTKTRKCNLEDKINNTINNK